jgi:hypothetical protein
MMLYINLTLNLSNDYNMKLDVADTGRKALAAIASRSYGLLFPRCPINHTNCGAIHVSTLQARKLRI